MKNWTNIIMLKGLLSKNWALLKSDHFGIEICITFATPEWTY